MRDDARLARTIADNDGIITSAQARALGLTRGAIRGREQRQEWQRLVGGVYLCNTHDFTAAARLRAAVAVHRGVADRTAAAYWHGMIDDLPAVVTLSVARSTAAKANAPFDASVVRRTFAAEDLEVVRGLEVTRRPLTVLMAAPLLDDPQAFLDRRLQLGEVTLESLQRAFERNSRRPGMTEIAPLLAAASTASEAESERAFAERLDDEQIGGWVQQFAFGRWLIDFAWPAEGIAVEIHGWAYHRDRRRFESDNAKAAALAAAGWLVIPFTWRQLADDPIGCIEKLVSAIRIRRELLG